MRRVFAVNHNGDWIGVVADWSSPTSRVDWWFCDVITVRTPFVVGGYTDSLQALEHLFSVLCQHKFPEVVERVSGYPIYTAEVHDGQAGELVPVSSLASGRPTNRGRKVKKSGTPRGV